ncbi:glycosyltransferase family 2 protein, partial [Pluralibacter gergoviae]|nr:glycosyltransferase family 2 protein [Pluralibacter gergoviae]
MILDRVEEKTLFSVVIPNYRRVIELKRAIDSVRIQLHYSDLVERIIIIDDNSENISEIEQLIRTYNDQKITLVKNNYKSNAAATRNQGAKIASTPWICFLDSDDAFHPDKFIQLREAIKSEADVYYNKAQVYFNGQIEDIVPHRALYEGEHISDYLFVHGHYMQTSTLTIKREFFEHSGFNEKYIRHQDYDLCLTFFDKKVKVEFCDFIGTLIYWNSNERPNKKGESYIYSSNWIVENRFRITERAYKFFYFNFVVLKAARSGAKLSSLRCFFKMKNKQVGLKKMLSYCL